MWNYRQDKEEALRPTEKVRNVAGSTDTLVVADANRVVFYSVACVVTIPTNAAVSFPIGHSVYLSAIQSLTFSFSGVTLVFGTASSDPSSDNFRNVGLTKLATNTWAFVGEKSS